MHCNTGFTYKNKLECAGLIFSTIDEAFKHCTDCAHEVQVTHHEKYYSACVNSGIMYFWL